MVCVTRWIRNRQRTDMPLLEIDNLKTWFHTRDGVVRAVDGISFELEKGKKSPNRIKRKTKLSKQLIQSCKKRKNRLRSC